MKKLFKVSTFAAILIFLSFILGWRVMPKIWPTIKSFAMNNIVYKFAPTPAMEPMPTPEPYIPQVNSNLKDQFAHTDSVIYYFYKNYCPYCVNLDAFFCAIPDLIVLEDGTRSLVRIVAVEKQVEPGKSIIEEYNAQYAIPEERDFVPAVVIGGEYYMSPNEITTNLYPSLLSGKGLVTPMLGENARMLE